MDDLEVRELRYFVAVAEELNFSRAAERLGISQPPLSRAISQLERRLGVQLFERDTRGVAVTVAGQTMLTEARTALEVMSRVARRTRRAGWAVPTLVTTAKPGIASGLLGRIVEVYAALPGSPRVEIVVSGYRQQADMVRDGRADAALLSSPYDERGLDSEPLTTEPRVAALPAAHRLARRSTLRCSDLHGERMPRWSGATPEECVYWSGRDRTDGRGRGIGAHQPEVTVPGPVVNDPTELLEVVSLGQAVALIPASLAEANLRTDVAYRPVDDASPYTVAVAWTRGARSPVLNSFVRSAIDVTTSEKGTAAPHVS